MSDFVEKNREHFNNTAASYNSKFEKTISAIIEEIQARLDWIGVDWISDSSDDDEISRTSAKASDKKPVRLLDYACGTGLVSRALAPYVTQCVGMDISENMVETYNTTAQNQGLPKSEMSAVVGNLLSPTEATPSALAGPEYHNFDIAVVGLGFHHFEDPKLAAKRLGERLKKGGVLFIIDFLPHDQHRFHGHDAQKAKHTVMHLGFSEEDVKTMFSGAGCDGGFEYSVVGKGIVFVTENGQTEQMKREVFMARGSKL